MKRHLSNRERKCWVPILRASEKELGTGEEREAAQERNLHHMPGACTTKKILHPEEKKLHSGKTEEDLTPFEREDLHTG